MKSKSNQDQDFLAAAYWVREMDEASAFIDRVLKQPLEECGEATVDIGEAAAERGVEVEFLAGPHATGWPRIFRARAEVVDHLLDAAAELREMDHTLRIEDAFRTYEMQRDLALSDELIGKVSAAVLLAEPTASTELIVRRLSVVVQTRARSAGHMAGAAVDVSVVGPEGADLERGGPYITVSEAMPMESEFVSAEARRNRRLITELMARHGFHAYPYEFWHYSRGDVFAHLVAGDSTPARYGPVRLAEDGSVTPIENQLESLIAGEDIGARGARVARLTAGRD